MRERLEQRLQELKEEFGKGQQTLEGLETQAAEVRQTLLRISGAIQVLEEELDEENQPHENGSELSVVESETADEPASGSGKV
jgi:uncharacterized coiled-coil protein SlyX